MSQTASQQMKRCPECGALADLKAPLCQCGHRFRTVVAGDDEITTNLSAPALDPTRSIPAVSPSPGAPQSSPPSPGAGERIARVLRIPFWFVIVVFGLYLIAVLIDSISAAFSG